MAKCESCGSELAEGDNFCFNCVAPVGKATKEEFRGSSHDLTTEVNRILHEGNVTRIIVKDGNGNILLEIPAWAGIVGAILAPWLAALGAIAAIATRCTLTVVRRG